MVTGPVLMPFHAAGIITTTTIITITTITTGIMTAVDRRDLVDLLVSFRLSGVATAIGLIVGVAGCTQSRRSNEPPERYGSGGSVVAPLNTEKGQPYSLVLAGSITMTACQKLVRSPSATLRASGDPITPLNMAGRRYDRPHLSDAPKRS
jgi:hypothetical protein